MQFPSTAQIIAMLPQVEMVIEPDSAFKYNNLASCVLGEIVHGFRAVHTQLCEQADPEPLGMESSGFEVVNPRNATGYMPDRYQDAPEVSPDPPTNGYLAAAGLRSCVTDLAKWVSLQFRTGDEKPSGEQVLSAKSLSEMHRVTFVEPGWLAGYGLTWMASRFGENVYMHHGGSVPGFLSMVAFSKAYKFGMVVLTNKQGNIASGAIAFEALEMITAEAKKAVSARTPQPTPENQRALVGRYVGMPAFGVIFHVEWREGRPRLATPVDPFMIPMPPSPLTATDKPNVFIVADGRLAGEPLTFELDETGRATGLQLSAHGGLFKKID